MSESDYLVEGLRIAAPLISDNRKAILQKIKNGYRRFSKNDYSFKASIYVTSFVDFKADYPLESINQHVCQILKKYQLNNNESKHKFNKTSFSVIRHFNYSDHLYAPDDFIQYGDYGLSEFEDEVEIKIPLVSGISFYLFPEGDALKTHLFDGYNLIEIILKEILKKYDVKQNGSFVYIQCEKTNDFNDFVKALNSKLKNYEGIRLRNLSKNENELKIINNLLVARILGEVL